MKPKHLPLFSLDNVGSGWPWNTEIPDWPDTMPDGSPWPKISIVTPSYNQGQFLEETIRSVLLQGYPHLEYIVIDGGSTDNSVDIIRHYEQWMNCWVSEKDSGQSEAINKGFGKASGEIYAWLNSDDIYLPEALHAIVSGFAQRDDCHILIGNGNKVDLNGQVLYRHPRKDLTIKGLANWPKNGFSQPSCFFSAHAWNNAGPLREDLHYAMDVGLWLAMVKQFSFHKIEQNLSLAKGHDEAKTTNEHTQMYSYVEMCALAVESGEFETGYKNLLKFADQQYARIERLSAKGDSKICRAIEAIARRFRTHDL